MWKWIILFAIIITIALIYLGWMIGSAYARQYKEYIKKYKLLKVAVEDGFLTETNFRNIRTMFEEISKYDCREDERLSVLEAEFYKRFAMFSTNENEKK